MSPFILLLAFVLASSLASAQGAYWQQTAGPFGGNVSQIASDSNGVMFAMADNGIYRSTSNGAEWTRSEDAPLRITFIAFAIARNGTYFATTANAGVFRSTDNGVSWQSASNGLPGSFTWSVAANPLADEVLVSTGPGVYRTTDNGDTWALTGNARITKPVVFDVDGTAYVGSDSGVMRSSDAERMTWEWTDSTIAGSPIVALIVRNDTLFAGMQSHGVFMSVDGGVTWSARNAGLVSLDIQAIDRGRPDEIFLSTRDGGLYRSTDEGELWVLTNPGSQLFISASTHHNSADRLFVATVKGLFYSDSHSVGADWYPSRVGFINSVIRTLIIGPQQELYAVQYTGNFHRSTDGGATWTIVDLEIPPDTDVSAMAMDSAGVLIATVRGVGLYASSDRGDTWTRYGVTLPSARPVGIAVGTGGKIFVTSDSGYVYTSVDNGASWQTSYTPDSPASLAALAVRGEMVLAGGELLFIRSTDGGATWQVGGPRAYTFAFGPDGTVYAGSFLGRVYRSTNFGESFQFTVTSQTTAQITAIAVNERGDVFAGGRPGMFMSTNDGATWERIEGGLLNPAVTSIVLDSAGVAYAGTYGGGVHKSLGPTTFAVAERAVTHGMRVVVDGDVTVALSTARSAQVVVDVVDAMGARVAVLHDGRLTAGAHRLLFDASSLASGAYLIRSVVDGIVTSAPIAIAR